MSELPDPKCDDCQEVEHSDVERLAEYAGISFEAQLLAMTLQGWQCCVNKAGLLKLCPQHEQERWDEHGHGV